MRWPKGWNDPSALALLKGTCINYLLIEDGTGLDAVAEQARASGIQVGTASAAPNGVNIVQGEWAGLKMSPSGSKDVVSAGPTGAPWVDSNGWKIRLESALRPGLAVWVDAAPKEPHLSSDSYVIGVCDSATYGARWVISPDENLAVGIASQKPEALETWKKLTQAANFFAAHADWVNYVPQAVVGVISDFSGDNEFLTQELLNLLARTNEQYRIIVKSQVSASSFAGLRAVIYADGNPPAPELRKQTLAFVESGGMLIAGPKWGPAPGVPAKYSDHPRYSSHTLGKGRVVIATSDMDDPYVVANDSVVLVSHRHDLLRFWNGGALSAFFTTSPDRKRSIAQMLFFAQELNGLITLNGPDSAAVRVAGQYRSAKLWTPETSTSVPVTMQPEKGAVELHLPPISRYAAVELEV
jgi:hypothetical protein